MDASTVFLELLQVSDSKKVSAVARATADLKNLVADIYDDIFQSCIKVYYATYSPRVYKRHGDVSGFNVYSGFCSEVNDVRIDAMYMPDSLLSYRGISTDEVLTNVTNGQRGSKVRDMPKTGTWPKNWSVKYPNAYSQYHVWSSSQSTIESILDDFDNNGKEALASIFWDMVYKYI